MQTDIEKIHDASMKILGATGVKFDHPDILKMIKKHDIRVSDQVAYFSEKQIMTWIQKAPGNFSLYARNPKYNAFVGGETTVFAAGYGATFIRDKNGAKRNAILTDYINFLKLVHQSDHFRINGGVLVQPADIPSAQPFPMLLYQSILHSDKCLMGGSDGDSETRQTMDLLNICFGDQQNLIEKPRLISIINSSSPLQFNRDSLEKLRLHALFGQPVLITAAVMGGTTGPVTLAGTIAQANAETLAGIAVSQMIREGTPVVYGNQSTLADMRSGAYVSASPEHALCLHFGARLAEYYNLPSRGGGAMSDAGFVSSQSGFESMLTMQTTLIEKMNIVVLSAGTLDSVMAMSYEKFILDLQIIAMAKRYVQGLHIDDQTLALEVINDVGPGGEYLTHDHTLNFCRTERSPVILDSGSTSRLKDHYEMINWLETKKDAMLETYQQPPLPNDLCTDMKKYLVNIGFDISLL